MVSRAMELIKRLFAFFIIIGVVRGFPKHLLYRHGYGFDQHLPKQDEVSSPEIKLAVPIVFYNEKYSSIFVSYSFFYYTSRYIKNDVLGNKPKFEFDLNLI